MKLKKILLLVLLLVIGFASVSTALFMNGKVGISANNSDFDIIFTDASISDDGSVSISPSKKEIVFSSSKLINLDDEVVVDYKIKNTSTQYDADVTINCSTAENEYISIKNELANQLISDTFQITLEAQEEKSGSLIASLIKAYSGDDASVDVTCKIIGNAIERDNINEPDYCDISNPPITEINSWLWKDNDCSKDLSIGDLITIDTESFYIYNLEGDTIKALAEYNLYVGNTCTSGATSSCTTLQNSTGLQDSRAIGYGTTPRIGTVKFGDSNSYSSSVVKSYIDQYAVKMSKKEPNITNVRLITKDELVELGCEKTCITAPKFTYNTSYWTSTAHPDYNNRIWFVYSFGSFGAVYINYDFEMGVRPVIEISKSVFE